MARGQFILSRTHEGWVFTEGPMRRMSPMAAYYANERGVMNHTGEPFVWVTCPFCGGDLPIPDGGLMWEKSQGDGDAE
jgi:hypothetical protein